MVERLPIEYIPQHHPNVTAPMRAKPRPFSPSRRRFLGLSLCAASACLALSCKRDDHVVEVDLSRTLADKDPDAGPDLHLAIGTMLSPRETLASYGQLTAWLGGRLGRRVILVQRKSYGETNDLLVRGEADVAFVCTGAFGAVRKKGARILAVPVVQGKTSYRSLIVVRRDDPATSFEDLRGSPVAFVDLLSLTGRIYPELLASRAAGDGGKFFGRTVYSHSHTDSMSMVREGRVRAAGVDSLVFEELGRKEPQKAAQLRVLVESEAFGIPPFVGRPGLEPALRDALRAALLAMHQDRQGADALEAVGFDRFEAGDESSYDSAQEILEHFAETGITP